MKSNFLNHLLNKLNVSNRNIHDFQEEYKLLCDCIFCVESEGSCTFKQVALLVLSDIWH